MASLLLCVVLVVSTSCVAALEEIPDFLNVCYPDEHELDCFTKNLVDIQPYLNTGYDRIDFPKLNPFTVDNFVVSPKASGFLLEIQNFEIYNAHNYTITNVKIVEHGKEYHIDVAWPRFYCNGTYKVDGQLLFLPLKGDGPANAWIDNISSKFVVKIGPIARKTGDPAPGVNTMDLKIKYGTIKTYFNNLFGDKEVSKTLNEAINNNIDGFASVLVPLVEQRFSYYFRKRTNKMLAHFTYDQLFPAAKQ